MEEGKTLHNRGQNGGLNVSPDVAPAAIAAAEAAGTVRTKESRESDAAQHGKAASDGARAGRRGDGGGEGVVLVARGKGTCMVRESGKRALSVVTKRNKINVCHRRGGNQQTG